MFQSIRHIFYELIQEDYEKATEVVIAEAKRLHDAAVPVEEAVKQAKFGDCRAWPGSASQGRSPFAGSTAN